MLFVYKWVLCLGDPFISFGCLLCLAKPQMTQRLPSPRLASPKPSPRHCRSDRLYKGLACQYWAARVPVSPARSSLALSLSSARLFGSGIREPAVILVILLYVQKRARRDRSAIYMVRSDKVPSVVGGEQPTALLFIISPFFFFHLVPSFFYLIHIFSIPWNTSVPMRRWADGPRCISFLKDPR